MELILAAILADEVTQGILQFVLVKMLPSTALEPAYRQRVYLVMLNLGGLAMAEVLTSDEIIPARGMIVNEKGQVVLTRYPTPNSSDRPADKTRNCSDRVFNNAQPTGIIFPDNFLVGAN